MATTNPRRETRRAEWIESLRDGDNTLSGLLDATDIRAMCGRFTRQYTWQQLHALYRLTVPAAIPNFQPDYNVCPTDPADVVVPNEGARELVRMRWGLVPYWWNKTLKESMRLASFNARVETVSTQSRSSGSRSRRSAA